MEKIERPQEVGFGDFRLKLHERQLVGPTGVVELSARAFDIVCLLVSHPHEIVPKSTIFDTVWPGVAVEDNTLQVHVSALRKSLPPEYVVTVQGRGYKYAGPMPYPTGSASETPVDTVITGERGLGSSTSDVPDAGAATAARHLSDKPSIAVMPLENLSGDPGQKYLSDGITEDIITELSRFKHLSVAARHASFQLGGKGAVLAARELNVHFVVEGSVRKSGERIRITVQLIDAVSGNHVWAERFDRETHDIFAVQDEVVSAIVATLEGRMVSAAVAQLRRKPTSSWTAYDFFLQGREIASLASEREAESFFARAVSIDPDFAHAYAWLAISHLGSFWLDAEPSTLDKARLAAQRALELDSNDPTVQHANGLIALWLGEHDRSSIHLERAVDLNPADMQIRADRADGMRFAGEPDKALAAIDDALQRSKFPPYWFWWIRAGILIDLGRYEEAVAAFANIPRKEYMAWLQLAVAHGHLGQASEAAQALAMARERKPNLTLRDVTATFPYARREALDHLLDGLRKAGLSE